MTLYVGDTVAIKVDLLDPFTKEALTGYTVTLDLYAPGKSPKTDPSVRGTPDVANVGAAYDSSVENSAGGLGAYVGYVDTTGLAAGTWSYRVTAAGIVYHDTEYGTFRLKA